MFVAIIISVFVCFVLPLVYWMTKANDLKRKIANVPGPRPLPFFGNVLDLKSPENILPYVLTLFHTFGEKPVKIFIGPDRVILFLFKYEHLEALFTSTKLIDKSSDYDHMQRWLGLGLLTSSGEKWKQRRKLITPSFHFQILESFISVFDSNSNTLVDLLKVKTEEPIDIYDNISHFTLDVICESAMGIKVNAQVNDSSEYVNSVKEMGKILVRRTVSPLKQHDFFYKFSNDYRKELKILKVLHGLTNLVIKKRRKELSEINEEKEKSNDVGSKTKHAFLDMLILAKTPDGKSLSDADIREEVNTFMFEGHDTTSSALMFLLISLSKYPLMQKQILDEINIVFGKDKKQPTTLKHLQDLKYLEMFIMETMRLYPPVPLYGRFTHEDFQLGDLLIPKGVSILISPHTIHRNPKYFSEPEKFDPERFNSTNKPKIKPFTYISFSAGPRNCIGQKFAMLEMKATISKILRHFEVLKVPGFEPIITTEGVLRSKNGVKIILKPR